MKFLSPLHSSFAAAELSKLRRQSGDLYSCIIWQSREAERKATQPWDQCLDISLGDWPIKRLELKDNVTKMRRGKP